ncbi:cation:proton antiporter domain-containing protein [Pseudomonas sp. TE3610]
MLFLHIVFIIFTAKTAGAVLKKFGQPEVVGEMIAGFLLGPLVLGYFYPGLQHALFQGDTTAQLKVLSDLGILLFMFVVGAEFRLPERRQAGAHGNVLLVAACSIALPFALGIAIAPLLYDAFAPAGAPRLGFELFIATVFSVTAFPVLARILKERQMLESATGAMALMAAALSDVCAWVLLAVTAMTLQLDSQWQVLTLRLGGLLVLCVFSFWVLRPLLRKWIANLEPTRRVTLLPALLCGAMIYGSITEWLQVHAVFGAFLFGACLPRDQRLLDMLVERVEHMAVIVLMPSFFALAGLNTTATAFAGVGLGLLGLVLAVAIIGKLLGGAMGARVAGYPMQEAIKVGILMNARGLMELVVLKVGLDLGVIGKDLFTLFVIMTVVTTVMTGPLLNMLGKLRPAPQPLGSR